MFYIIIGGVVEAVSIISASIININSSYEDILELPKSGYKIDYDTYEKYINEVVSNNKKQNLKKGLLLIPGVNVICSFINKAKNKNSFVNEPLIKENKILMTDKEKERFNSLENKYQKILYTMFMIIEDTEERDLSFDGLQPVIVDNCLLKLNNQLLPLAYSLDEVKKLNEVTNYSYRLGQIDGVNTAIIGIPNQEYQVKRINYNFDENNETHNFVSMNDDEALNKTFVVYLFNENEEMVKKVDEMIDVIRNKRSDNKRYHAINFDDVSLYQDKPLKRIRRR